MFEDDIDNLIGCGVAVAVTYGAFVALGLALLVICVVVGTLLFTLLDAAAYVAGQPNDAGPWLLVPWIVILPPSVIGWCCYRRFRQQRRSRQASPVSVPSPAPLSSVLLEAMQVVEDAEKRYDEM